LGRTAFRFHFEWLAGGVHVRVVDDIGEGDFVAGADDQVGDDVRRALVVVLCCGQTAGGLVSEIKLENLIEKSRLTLTDEDVIAGRQLCDIGADDAVGGTVNQNFFLKKENYVHDRKLCVRCVGAVPLEQGGVACLPPPAGAGDQDGECTGTEGHGHSSECSEEAELERIEFQYRKSPRGVEGGQ